jgi:nitroreductase
MSTSTVTPEAVAGIVALACRAPSLHNSQPWHLTAHDGELRLFLAAQHAPDATDPSGRELVMSCGALLDHLRVAAAAAGWTTGVDRFPNPNNLDHLATVRFHPSPLVTEAEYARAEAILQRRTDRLPFARPDSWGYIEPLLRNAVDPVQATLHVLADAARPQLAEASLLTEALRRYDTSYQAELLWWTAPHGASEGLPASVLPATSERGRVDLARNFPVGTQQDQRPEVTSDHSVVAVLSTEGDDRRTALSCGEALSAVLLEATMAGLATCPLSHITELAASRDIVRDLTGGDDDPQILIRIGAVPALAEQPPATPRRPLAEVLTIS